uniref:Uncharacterized protein isoform X1 n=1 Tax=Pogona vitticeps TaxID=103695 RepID=A0ABM5G4T4_9SAUR
MMPVSLLALLTVWPAVASAWCGTVYSLALGSQTRPGRAGGAPAGGRSRRECARSPARCSLVAPAYHLCSFGIPRPSALPVPREHRGQRGWTGGGERPRKTWKPSFSLAEHFPFSFPFQGGYTPLHVAALHGHQHLMELLIGTFGAGQNIRDYSGHLAMHYLHTEASDRAPATPQLGPTRGERTRNRKRACLLLPKNSSGRPRRPWGSASDLAEEKPDQEGWREGGLPQQQQQQPPEQGKAPGHLSLPPSYRPVRKFSR